ncbi:MAG: class I SAM-dependent rRNA methyltransferase [Myxococcales bacterium]|nr:class I SAM-dependent rRNA methyltransferase [Myxococcales bacterium]
MIRPGQDAAPPRARARGVQARDGQYRLPDDVARRVILGHPWVFREALGRPVTEPTGTLVEMIGGNREFLGRGFVDQDHPVAIRMLTRDAREAVHPGAGAIVRRFEKAFQTRWILFGQERPNALRLFTGDSEGFPGVTVDRYGDFVLLQWLSAGSLPWRDELLDAIERVVRPRGIYEQKRLRPLGGQAAPEPAVRARGDEAPLEIVVEEAGAKFSVDVTAPLGVGMFPDLRLGRDAVTRKAAGRRVINLFSYTGAFSVRAALAGATEVVAVDTAARAHARARRNYELSGLDPASMEQITGDAQKALEKFADRGRRFDLVICDPPTFSHGSAPSESFSVTRDMVSVIAASLRVLEPGGFMALSTNSVKMSPADLDRALADAAGVAHADVRIVERVGLPPDYLVAPGFPEGNYLKFLMALRV